MGKAKAKAKAKASTSLTAHSGEEHVKRKYRKTGNPRGAKPCMGVYEVGLERFNDDGSPYVVAEHRKKYAAEWAAAHAGYHTQAARKARKELKEKALRAKAKQVKAACRKDTAR